MSLPENDRRIDYIEFQAVDLEATKAFYSDAFGWTFQDYGPGYTAFQDGRLDGGFAKTDEIPKGGGPLVVLYAVDLEAVLEKVRAAGGTIVKPTFDFPGGRRFHFQDPNGNVLAVWTDQPAQ
ncbi:MAG: VOC family protein [Acidobacteria bacterium]|nr:VOC family protein [Acidobacteriota bacterium]